MDNIVMLKNRMPPTKSIAFVTELCPISARFREANLTPPSLSRIKENHLDPSGAGRDYAVSKPEICEN